jgi:hypothetical protein
MNFGFKLNEAFRHNTVELIKLMNYKLPNKKPFKCCDANPTGRQVFKRQQSCFEEQQCNVNDGFS